MTTEGQPEQPEDVSPSLLLGALDAVLSHKISGSKIQPKLLPRLSSSILRQAGTAEVKTVCHRPRDGQETFDSATRIFYQATGMRYEFSGDLISSAAPPRPGLPYSNSAKNDNLIQELNKRLRKQQARFNRTSINTVTNTAVFLNANSSLDLANGIHASPAAASMSELDIDIGFNHHIAARLLANSKVSSLRKASISLHAEPRDTSYSSCTTPTFDNTLTAWNLNVASLTMPRIGAAPLSKPVPKPCQRCKQPATFTQLPASLSDLSLSGYTGSVPLDLAPALQASGAALKSLQLRNLQLQRQLPFSSLTSLESLSLSGLTFPPAPPKPAQAAAPAAAPQQPGQQNQNQNQQHLPHQGGQAPQQAAAQPLAHQQNQPAGQGPAAAAQPAAAPGRQPKPQQEPQPQQYYFDVNAIALLKRLKHLHAPELRIPPQGLPLLAAAMPSLRTVVAACLSISTSCPFASVTHLTICSEYYPFPAATAAVAEPPGQANGRATFRIVSRLPLAVFIQAKGLAKVFPEAEMLVVHGTPLPQVLAAAANHPSIHTLVTIGAPGLRGGAATAQLGMLPALRAVHLHSKAGSFGAHALALLPSLHAPCTAVSELLLRALPHDGTVDVRVPEVPPALMEHLASPVVAKGLAKLVLRSCLPLYESELKALLEALPALRDVEVGVVARSSMGQAALEGWKERVAREVFGGRGLKVVEAEGRWLCGYDFRAVKAEQQG